jgi:hypothetical protein
MAQNRKGSSNRINVTVRTDSTTSMAFRANSQDGHQTSRPVSSDLPVTIDEEPSSDESSNSDSDTSTIALQAQMNRNKQDFVIMHNPRFKMKN